MMRCWSEHMLQWRRTHAKLQKEMKLSNEREKKLTQCRGQKGTMSKAPNSRVTGWEVVRDWSVTSAHGEWRRKRFLIKYFVRVLGQNCHNVSKLLFSWDPIVFMCQCYNCFNDINNENEKRLSWAHKEYCIDCFFISFLAFGVTDILLQQNICRVNSCWIVIRNHDNKSHYTAVQFWQ